MERGVSGHTPVVPLSSVTAAAQPPPEVAVSGQTAPAFDDVYAEHFSFVWRSVRRLGVDASAVDDVVQDVFLVVHRRLSDFEGRSSIRSWLFGIVARTVRDHRRTLRRKPAQLGGAAAREEADDLGDTHGQTPHDSAAKAEAVRALHAVLETMPDERREVFILAELEQMTVPEIAQAIGANVNTVYSRLRAARADFEQGVLRAQARDGWRLGERGRRPREDGT
jgi:RNA polymerase sigma-70 factor (ECF subfamily)